MPGKWLHHFDECAAECVQLWTSSSWGESLMYTPGTIANLQWMPN